jgi:ribose 5-phosphate isomerase B
MTDTSTTLLANPGDTVAIASDHAGVDLKETLKGDLGALGFKVLDLGTNGPASVDYPDYGKALAEAVTGGKAKAGVAVCGSGIGISIAANRVPGARAALVHDETTAALAREHNDANIIAMGARVLKPELARAMLKTFFATPFAGGRHAGRVAKLG